jgi:pentalenolactone synthase
MDDLLALPFDRSGVLGVAPLLRSLQAERPIVRVRTSVGDEAWLVTRHEDVFALLADHRLGTSHPAPEQAARATNSALFGGARGNYKTEQADHAQMRALLAPSFSARRMRALQPRIEGWVDQLLNRLADATRPADLHEALSVPLPVLVICELLGVPYADRDRFRAWSDGAGDIVDRKRSQQSLTALIGYMHELMERKRADPAEDVISDLIAAQDDGLGDDRIAALSAGLLFAGHATTVERIDLGTLLLLTNPGQRDALLRDPDLVSSTVEEILRCMPGGGGGLPRYARADLVIDGVTIRAGELILLDLAAANHDGRTFPEPDRFDIARTPNPHVTFGYGSHYCIGATLARVELRAVFSRLFTCFPTLRLAVPVDQLRPRSRILAGGLHALPVEW